MKTLLKALLGLGVAAAALVGLTSTASAAVIFEPADNDGVYSVLNANIVVVNGVALIDPTPVGTVIEQGSNNGVGFVVTEIKVTNTGNESVSVPLTLQWFPGNNDSVGLDLYAGSTSGGVGATPVAVVWSGDAGNDVYETYTLTLAPNESQYLSLDLTGWDATNNNIQINGTLSTVPEPATMVLLGTGLAGMAAARRRRMKKTAA